MSSLWTERFRQAPFEASLTDDRGSASAARTGCPLGEVVASTRCSTSSTATRSATSTRARTRRSAATCARAGTVDRDPFEINQLGHPYQGSMYHGFARSAGPRLLGVARLHVRGQRAVGDRRRDDAAVGNDQITTGIGGTFLGEALFRMASLMLENADGMPPLLARGRRGGDLAADRLQPARLRRALRPRSSRAATRPTTAACSSAAAAPRRTTPGTSTTKLDRNEAQADFAIDYGLPGKPGYRYRRPFDYFTFQATASSANGFENMMTRGLLVGTRLRRGHATTAASGACTAATTTSRRRSSACRARRCRSARPANGGSTRVGRAAGHGARRRGLHGGRHDRTAPRERDYHYGVAPQALLAWRTIFGDRVALDVTGREYFVSRVASINDRGRDIIGRIDAGLTWRVLQATRRVASSTSATSATRTTAAVDQSQSRNDDRAVLHVPRQGRPGGGAAAAVVIVVRSVSQHPRQPERKLRETRG